MFLGTPTEFPALKEKSYKILPGHGNIVEVTAYRVTSENSVKDLEPSERKCYFPDEYHLDFHVNYTYTSCKFECAIKVAESRMGCIPWYMPQRNNYETCDPWDTRKFLEEMEQAKMSSCPSCLPDCQTIKYRSVLNTAPFRQETCRMMSIRLTANRSIKGRVNKSFFSSVRN